MSGIRYMQISTDACAALLLNAERRITMAEIKVAMARYTAHIIATDDGKEHYILHVCEQCDSYGRLLPIASQHRYYAFETGSDCYDFLAGRAKLYTRLED